MSPEQLLRALGATGKLKGFCYAVHMIDRVEADPTAITLITKALYPDTAKRFGVPACRVERNLRTLVKVCWTQSDRTLWEQMAGFHLQRKPTNGEFLDMAAAYLRRDARS